MSAVPESAGGAVQIRPATSLDIDVLTALNNAAVPAVSAADTERMGELVDLASHAWAVDSRAGADAGTGVIAFALLFEPGSSYESPNYRWFSSRFDRFLYVDRIVVGEAARNQGIGAVIYDAVIAEAARRELGRVAAEVNLAPPNPGSSRFHRRKGFGPVGTLDSGPDHVVEMLVRPVDEDAAAH